MSTQLGAFTVLQPADPGRQALERHPLLGLPDPADQAALLREGIEHGAIGLRDVRGITRKRYPAKRAGAPAEEWPDEFGYEPGYVERLSHAPSIRDLAPEIVAVVEGDRAPGLEVQHGPHVHSHGVEYPLFIADRI